MGPLNEAERNENVSFDYKNLITHWGPYYAWKCVRNTQLIILFIIRVYIFTDNILECVRLYAGRREYIFWLIANVSGPTTSHGKE